MSTTFGIKHKNKEITEIAFRYNNGSIKWLNEIAYLLPDDTKVIAIDNTPQGITNIKDIKNEIKENKQ